MAWLTKTDIKNTRIRNSIVLMGGVFMASAALAKVEIDTRPEAEQLAPCLANDQTAPYILLTIDEIYDAKGHIRVQAYSDKKEEFLAKGMKLLRVEVPVQEGEKRVCVTMPGEGAYSLVVLHDRNSNGKTNFFSDGFGFSLNPKLGLGPPDHEETLFEVKNGVMEMTIHTKYVFKTTKKDKKSSSR